MITDSEAVRRRSGQAQLGRNTNGIHNSNTTRENECGSELKQTPSELSTALNKRTVGVEIKKTHVGEKLSNKKKGVAGCFFLPTTGRPRKGRPKVSQRSGSQRTSQPKRCSRHDERPVFREQRERLFGVGLQITVQRAETSADDIPLPPPPGGIYSHDPALTNSASILSSGTRETPAGDLHRASPAFRYPRL